MLRAGFRAIRETVAARNTRKLPLEHGAGVITYGRVSVKEQFASQLILSMPD